MDQLIAQQQLKLKLKGEQILCHIHKEPIIQLNISQNKKLGERLMCGFCYTFVGQKLLQLKDAEDLLYQSYQQEQQMIYLELVKFSQQINSIETLLKEVQTFFDNLVNSLHQQLLINKERLNQQKSTTQLSYFIEKIANSQALSDQLFQQIAEFISNQSIVNGKIELNEKAQISNSSIQGSNDRIIAFLNSIQDLLAKQQNLLDYDKFNYTYPIQLEGHNDFITTVAMSNNDQLMASGDCEGQILLWELDSKSLKQKYNGEKWIKGLIFSPDDKLLAAAQYNVPYDILIFNIYTPSQTDTYMTLKGHSSTVCRLAFTLDSHFMISGSSDDTFRIWNLDQQKCVVNQKLSYCVYGVDISQDQQYISACCQLGQAYLFNSTNIENLKEIAQWKAHQYYAYGTTFTPDSQMLLTCGFGDIKLWKITQFLSTDQLKPPFRVYKTENEYSYFWSVQTRLNGSILISNNGKIRIWNKESGKLIQTLDVPEEYQYNDDYNFSVSKDMKYIITGGKNKKLKVYELTTKKG